MMMTIIIITIVTALEMLFFHQRGVIAWIFTFVAPDHFCTLQCEKLKPFMRMTMKWNENVH